MSFKYVSPSTSKISVKILTWARTLLPEVSKHAITSLPNRYMHKRIFQVCDFHLREISKGKHKIDLGSIKASILPSSLQTAQRDRIEHTESMVNIDEQLVLI